MRHLYRQWRLLRFLDKVVHLVDDESPSQWKLDPSALVQDVANRYAKEKHVLPIDSERLIRSCIKDGYISERDDDDGTFIWISPGAGQRFLALPSGLILEEIKLIGPLWTFFAGIVVSVLTLLGIHQI